MLAALEGVVVNEGVETVKPDVTETRRDNVVHTEKPNMVVIYREWKVNTICLHRCKSYTTLRQRMRGKVPLICLAEF
jgi:hypothetical protein